MDTWMIIVLAIFVLASIAMVVYFVREKKYTYVLYTTLSLIVIIVLFYFLGVIFE